MRASGSPDCLLHVGYCTFPSDLMRPEVGLPCVSFALCLPSFPPLVRGMPLGDSVANHYLIYVRVGDRVYSGLLGVVALLTVGGVLIFLVALGGVGCVRSVLMSLVWPTVVGPLGSIGVGSSLH